MQFSIEDYKQTRAETQVSYTTDSSAEVVMLLLVQLLLLQLSSFPFPGLHPVAELQFMRCLLVHNFRARHACQEPHCQVLLAFQKAHTWCHNDFALLVSFILTNCLQVFGIPNVVQLANL